MASLLVESAGEEEDGIRTLKELPDALLVFIMGFLRGDFMCWASLLGTCKYIHNHHVDNLAKLKTLWEKAQSIQCSDRAKRALYNSYFYSTIDLGYTNIGAEGAKYVAEALKVNTSLTEIGLGWDNIGAEGAKYVAEALKVNTSLTEIHLGSNSIGDEGAKYVAQALKVNTSLTEIHLDYNDIGDEGAEYVAEALKVNTSLTEIDLSENDIWEGVHSLSKAWKHRYGLLV